MATRASLSRKAKTEAKKRFYGENTVLEDQTYETSEHDTEGTEYNSDSSCSYDSDEEDRFLCGEDPIQERYVFC